jgi:NAD(P)-dependent dehydrogenase (short-subunit alcohol dehydrogenase family)
VAGAHGVGEHGRVTEPRVVLVTGASTGIGRATATLLADAGFRVFGTSRDGHRPAGVPYEMLPLELSSAASVQACVDAVLAREGRIDVLFNNAGFGVLGAVEEVSDEEAQAQLEVFLFGVHRMVRAVLPTMRARGGGHIVTMSSVASTTAIPFAGLYVAGKQALAGLTESLRYEVAGFGIAVSYLEASFIRTDAADDAVVAAPVAAYGPWRDRAVRAFLSGIRHGKDPQLVARAVLAVVQDPEPTLVHRVDAVARALPVVRAVAPQRLWDGLFAGYRRVAGGTRGGRARRRRPLPAEGPPSTTG